MKPAGAVVVKSAADLAQMRQAGRVAAAALREIAATVSPGVTTAELDRVGETFIRDHGAVPSFKNYRGYPASICTSINDEVVHGIPGSRVLLPGEIVSIDLGVYLHGFHVDVAETVPVGQVAPRVRLLLDVTARALDAGIARAVAGSTLGDVGWAIQSVVEASGFSCVRDFAGHGIGRALHEEPQVPNLGRPRTGTRLAPGMTLAIEPMVNMGAPDVYIADDGWTVRTRDGSWSAHAEHTVAITPDGPQILTGLDGAGDHILGYCG
jgi:methionyl aminopeptidase